MLSAEEFDQLVADGIDAIPEEFARLLDNVAVVVQDEPSREQARQLGLRRGWTLFGLYEGIPKTKRTGSYSGVLPDKITIFKRPIEHAARSREDITEMVKNTVWHEIAHHFGMDESQVRAAEAKRQQGWTK